MSASPRESPGTAVHIAGSPAAPVLTEVRTVTGPGGPLAVVRKRVLARGRLPAVVLVHGFAQNRHSWEVPGRSLPDFLATSGFDVFNPDLRGVGDSARLGSRPARAFADYVDGDLPALVDDAAAASGSGRVFLVGHSLGGAVACAYAGRRPDRVRGVATVSGIYRFASASRLMRLAGIAAMVLDHRGARAPGPAATGSMPALVRTDLIGCCLQATRVLLDLAPARLLPLHAWAPGSIEPEVLEQAIRLSFEPVSLPLALELAARARGRDPEDAAGVPYFAPFERLDSIPLLVIAAEGDRLVSAADAGAAFERSASRDRTLVRLGGECAPGFGHIDVLLGRDAPRRVWSVLLDWMAARSGPSTDMANSGH